MLVLAPTPGAVPPAGAVLGAREGRRVVWLASWGSEAETRAALEKTGLSKASLDALLRFVVVLREEAR